MAEIDAPRQDAMLLRRNRWSTPTLNRTDGSISRVSDGKPQARRMTGLDGLRAVAVIAVVLFHLDYTILPGGFLGVDIFFVISGFLISYIVADEIMNSGKFRLGRFYVRRVRRLLPSVALLSVVLVIASMFVWTDQLPTLTEAVFSSLLYVTNWWLIGDHQSYFASAGRPSMFQHLWSLAVEEQFYIVWSIFALAIAGRRAAYLRKAQRIRLLRLLAIYAAGLALLSTATMIWIAVRHGVPYRADTSRVYFGSDTHSAGLFVGSAAGYWIATVRYRGNSVSSPPLRYRWFTDIIGLVSLAIAIHELWSVNEFSVSLYRGGLLLFDCMVLIAVVCLTRPHSIGGSLLDLAPLRWLGRRSYSIYLWHWPVCVVTRPGLDVHGPEWIVNLLRLALILGLSQLSYQFVESRWRQPQSPTSNPPVRSQHSTSRTTTRNRKPVLLTAAVIILSAGALDIAGAAGSETVRRTPEASRPLGSHPTSAHPRLPTAPRARPTARPRLSPAPEAPSKPAISVFGDSVVLGAVPSLRSATRALSVDAVEGRQAYDVLNDIRAAAKNGRLRNTVLIHIGNNGIISPTQLTSTAESLTEAARVLIVTDRVPRDWQQPNNDTIRGLNDQYQNVRVVDWYAASSGHPDWFYPDGIHLDPVGAEAYTKIIVAAANS